MHGSDVQHDFSKWERNVRNVNYEYMARAFWWNSYEQWAVQAVNIMVFSAEKHVFLVEHYLKKQSFKTTQSDYSHRFACPAPAKSGI
jgi:hypothetical protein